MGVRKKVCSDLQGGMNGIAAGQTIANQQQPQQPAGGSYMNLPTPATTTQAQQLSQFEIRADGTLGWRR